MDEVVANFRFKCIDWGITAMPWYRMLFIGYICI
jgi:hypothetical protein